jgi:hypothetical protein
VPRPDIRMAPEEVRSLLAAHRFAVVVTIDEHGDPVGCLAPVRFDAAADRVVVPAGALLGGDGSADQICVLVEEQPTYDAMRAAAVHGVPVAVADTGEEVGIALDDVVSFDFGRAGRPGA